MILRESQRQKHKINMIKGYPLVTTYKYLGVHMRNDGKLKDDMKYRRDVKNKIQQKMWILNNQSLEGKAKVQLWEALFRSRWAYAHQLLTTIDKNFAEWVKKQHYQGIKTLLKTRLRVGKDKLLEMALGQKWECWQSVINRRHFDRMHIKRNPQICGCT